MDVCVYSCLTTTGSAAAARLLTCLLWNTWQHEHADVLRSFAHIGSFGFCARPPPPDAYRDLEDPDDEKLAEPDAYPAALAGVKVALRRCFAALGVASVTDLGVCASKCAAVES